MADRWRIEPEYAVKVDKSLGVLGVLLEPTALSSVGIIHRTAPHRTAH